MVVWTAPGATRFCGIRNNAVSVVIAISLRRKRKPRHIRVIEKLNGRTRLAVEILPGLD
jgi:hypothetical protein